MKVKMIRRSLVLVDGFCLESFEAGETYEVRESVGCYLINRGKARFVISDVLALRECE